MKSFWKYLPFLFLCSCAGMVRDCSSCSAENFGSDWIVVQYGVDGKPFNCWQVRNTAVTNERGTDGIYWQEGYHLVHVSGWYNRVQVSNNNFESAAKAVGVELAFCKNGAYVIPTGK